VKHLVESIATIESKRRELATALGYPRRGVVFRSGENVTGDPRHDPGVITDGLAVVDSSGIAAVIEVDEATEARLPAPLRALLKREDQLPAAIVEARAARAATDPHNTAIPPKNTPRPNS